MDSWRWQAATEGCVQRDESSKRVIIQAGTSIACMYTIVCMHIYIYYTLYTYICMPYYIYIHNILHIIYVYIIYTYNIIHTYIYACVLRMYMCSKTHRRLCLPDTLLCTPPPCSP